MGLSQNDTFKSTGNMHNGHAATHPLFLSGRKLQQQNKYDFYTQILASDLPLRSTVIQSSPMKSISLKKGQLSIARAAQNTHNVVAHSNVIK